MQYALWTLVSLIGYVAGLVILLRVTPMLLVRSYEEGLFMGIAALDILGALLAFGAVAITFGLFSGNIGIRVLDFFLLIGILGICARLAMLSFRPRSIADKPLASRIIAGGYAAFLVLASLYCIVLLFVPAL